MLAETERKIEKSLKGCGNSVFADSKYSEPAVGKHLERPFVKCRVVEESKVFRTAKIGATGANIQIQNGVSNIEVEIECTSLQLRGTVH